MTRTWLSLASATVGSMIGASVLALPGGPVLAAEMHVMESRPAAQAVMDGDQTEFFIRFDGPVDHAASVLSVIRDGRVVQTLHPRLNSQPNTLYSGVRRLAPGAYTLRWTTYSMRDHDVSRGDIAFNVK